MSDFMLDPDAYTRFIGLSAARASDPLLYKQFTTRLLSKFPDANLETENFYDAMYFMAYAMFGAGPVAELTGPGIASGMLRLLDGQQSYDVGPTEISSVE